MIYASHRIIYYFTIDLIASPMLNRIMMVHRCLIASPMLNPRETWASLLSLSLSSSDETALLYRRSIAYTRVCVLRSRFT